MWLKSNHKIPLDEEIIARGNNEDWYRFDWDPFEYSSYYY